MVCAVDCKKATALCLVQYLALQSAWLSGCGCPLRLFRQALSASCVHSPTNRRGSNTASRARAMRRHAAEAAGGMPEPYRLRAVGHSLGGASLLIYVVMCRQLGRPHHIYRLILLTPAGFLQKLPLVCWSAVWRCFYLELTVSR